MRQPPSRVILGLGPRVIIQTRRCLIAPRRQARQRCIGSGQRLPRQRTREPQRLIEFVRAHFVAGIGGSQQETNIELVIYGVITLYERYPPRPAAETSTP